MTNEQFQAIESQYHNVREAHDILDSANAPAGPLVDRVRWVVERLREETERAERNMDDFAKYECKCVEELEPQLAASQATNARLVELLRECKEYLPITDVGAMAKLRSAELLSRIDAELANVNGDAKPSTKA